MRKPLRFPYHYFEKAPSQILKPLRAYDGKDHRRSLIDSFREEGLIGINDDDCAILPRILPGSYLPTIRTTAREITTFVLRLLSLPEDEVRAIVPQGPIRDFLLKELQVLKHRPRRLTGCFRFDMAIVGPPEADNPPKLLEINEIGFDGLHRSSLIQRSLFHLIPEIRNHLFALDTSQAEVRNMRRLGPDLHRFQYDLYNWEEEVLVRTGRRHDLNVSLVTPSHFGCGEDRDFPLMRERKVTLSGGRLKVGADFPSAVQMGFSFELKDYEEAADLYAMVVRSRTPQYSPFLSGLVASKSVLVLLDDLLLRKRLMPGARFLQNAILPAVPLYGNRDNVKAEFENVVIKHVDGMGGEMVFIGRDVLNRLRRIPNRELGHWIVQARTRLNTVKVHGILSRPRKVISDLGVFVHYDWAGGKFLNFEVGGFISRATDRSYKVNVSGGGIQVPVMFTRKG